MIGGNTEVTKGTLGVEGSPPSLPSFVSDVGFAMARWVDAPGLALRRARRGGLPAARSGRHEEPAPGPDRRLLRRLGPSGLGRGKLADSGHLRLGLAGHLHPHQQGRARQSRLHQDEAGDVHRRRFGLGAGQRRAVGHARAGAAADDRGATFRSAEIGRRTPASCPTQTGRTAMSQHSDHEVALELSLQRFGLMVGEPDREGVAPATAGPGRDRLPPRRRS